MLDDKINKTLAKFVAASLMTISPNCKIIKADCECGGFFCDAQLDFDDFVILGGILEDRIKNYLQDKKRFENIFMQKQNAKEYFSHMGFKHKIDELENIKKSVVSIIKLDNFLDLSEDDFFYDIDFFKILKIKKIDGKTRVFGKCFGSASEYKKYRKTQKNYKSHLEIGEKENLFYVLGDKVIWTSIGIGYFDFVKKYIKDLLKKEGFLFVKRENLKIADDFLLKKENQEFPVFFIEEKTKEGFLNYFQKGLFSTNKNFEFCGSCFVLKKDFDYMLIYILKLFIKIVDSFGLKFSVLVKKSRKLFFEKKLKKANIGYFLEDKMPFDIGLFIEDSSGLLHAGPYLDVKTSLNKEKPYVNIEINFGGIGRYIAFILENRKKSFFLSPVQVLLLPLKKDDFEYAKNIEYSLYKHGIRAYTDYRLLPIKDRIRNGSFFVSILGEKERKNGKISFKKFDENNIEELDSDAFFKKLKRMNIENK